MGSRARAAPFFVTVPWIGPLPPRTLRVRPRSASMHRMDVVGKVFVHVTMSLDGFVAGPRPTPEQPMGEGGMRLHDWVFKASASDVDTAILQELFATTGAVILGRRTFDVGLGAWEDTPFPVPCFVLTHRGRDPLPM